MTDITYPMTPTYNSSSGLVFNLESTNLDLSGSNIFNIRGASRGSAISTTRDPKSSKSNTLTLTDVKFFNLQSSLNGGAVYTNNVNATILNCEFSYNQANLSGGAV